MVSDFNEYWYLGVFLSAELVGNDETCIHMPEFWYGGHLGDFYVCIQTQPIEQCSELNKTLRNVVLHV